MKKSILTWLAAIMILITLPYCKKKKTDSCGSEASLAVTTTPANGTTELPAPGPTFPLRVSITSAIPASGVTIDVKARPDGSSTTFFTESRSSSAKDNDFTITSTPSTVVCIVEITVTSKTCSTNKWSGSYRYSKK
jgi:hypothetical protein